MPALVTVDAAAAPMERVPETSSAPVLVTGPSRVSVAVPGPAASAVSVPSFSSPEMTERLAPADPVVDAPPVPTVNELPFATVSSPTVIATVWSTTVAPPGIHASTAVASGTPALQLSAVPQSAVAAAPVQVSVQPSEVSAAGAVSMPVAPEITKPPATTPR